MLSIRGLLLLGTLLAAAASAGAQSERPFEAIPKAEIAIDYSYMRANAPPGQCGCFNLNGGNAEVAVRTYWNFSAVLDISGEYASKTSSAGQPLALFLYTVGPRFSYPLRRSARTRITPFVQGLAGAVHGFDAPFPNNSAVTPNSANSLAVLVGGGVDLSVSRRFEIRAIQVDYGLNHLPNNANNIENLLRVSAGVVLRLR